MYQSSSEFGFKYSVNFFIYAICLYIFFFFCKLMLTFMQGSKEEWNIHWSKLS
jgi:hypothetical protein